MSIKALLTKSHLTQHPVGGQLIFSAVRLDKDVLVWPSVWFQLAGFSWKRGQLFIGTEQFNTQVHSLL